MFEADLHREFERLGEGVSLAALDPASSAGLLGRRSGLPGTGPRRPSVRMLRDLRAAIAYNAVITDHGSTALPMCALATVEGPTPFVCRQACEQFVLARTPGRRAAIRHALRRVTPVTALWQGAADVLFDHFGVPRERMSIVSNGVPAERAFCRYSASGRGEATIRAQSGTAHSAVHRCTGRKKECRCPLTSQARASSARLAASDGWAKLPTPSLQARAQDLAIGTVPMHHPIRSAARAISAADVIGLTSQGGDSMPAVLVEAGMMGVPAVAAPVEASVDLITDGATDRITLPDDTGATALAVVDVHDHRHQDGQAATRHRIAHFEIREVAQE